MNGYLPKRDLIFFNPGRSGVLFTHTANYYITVEQLLKAQKSLVQQTAHPVIYIEDRRPPQKGSQAVEIHQEARS